MQQLRIQRPRKFIFFCGGATSNDDENTISLRHFLLKEKNISNRLDAEIILAESANQIYRDTKYRDLITFEEDIAVISSLILVIVESPGSFAELGAFSSDRPLRKSLAIIMQEKYSESESFIRYGPVQRIKIFDKEKVAFFPWKTHRNGRIVKTSANPHIKPIITFINKHIKKSPQSVQYSRDSKVSRFLILYWIIYLSTAIKLYDLKEHYDYIYGCSDYKDFQNWLYCMKLANWIKSYNYSDEEYFYVCYDVDPLDYSFKSNVIDKDSIRRKSDVAMYFHQALKTPRHVREVAVTHRSKKV